MDVICVRGVHCQCARANLIEAEVVPCQHELRNCCCLWPQHSSPSHGPDKDCGTQKEQDEAFASSVCTSSLSWKPLHKRRASPSQAGEPTSSVGSPHLFPELLSIYCKAGQGCQCWFCHPVKNTFLHSLDKEIYCFNTKKSKIPVFTLPRPVWKQACSKKAVFAWGTVHTWKPTVSSIFKINIDLICLFCCTWEAVMGHPPQG